MNTKVNNWIPTKSYLKDDVVLYGNKYYFALKKNSNFRPDMYNSSVHGSANSPNSVWATDEKFLWLPSYNESLSNSPRLRVFDRDKPYFHVRPDGINHQLSGIRCVFSERKLIECRAIATFLNIKEGFKKFVFDLPKGYDRSDSIYCICREWIVTPKFYDNYTISAIFEEVVV